MTTNLTGLSKWWLHYKNNNPAITARWFFFHHAGGSASSYARWSKLIPQHVEMYSVELPGRGTRFHEPFAKHWTEIIAPMAHAISHLLDLPFIFFGHSMGGSMAFETCQYLRAHSQPLPQHLFIAGRHAPTRPRKLTYHHLPNNEFIEYLREKQGTPEDVLNEADLMKVLIPRLRADFKLNDSYQPVHRPKLTVPITVYAGTNEEGEHLDFADWNKQTDGNFELKYFPGNHFFVNPHASAIIAHMKNLLRHHQTSLPT